MLVLLWLPSSQVENKWRGKNLLTSEPFWQTYIFQLKWYFNLQVKIRKIAYPTVDSLVGLLE